MSPVAKLFIVVITWQLGVGVLCCETPTTQLNGLNDFFHSTYSPSTPWYNSIGWGNGQPCYGWFGVTCDSQCNIIALDLGANRLIGTLPNSFANLVYLETLELDNNQISGTIPPIINFTQLKKLSLEHNQFRGSVVDIGPLSSLAYFSIAFNNISGSLPNTFGSSKLVYLDYEHNNISGIIPPSIGNLQNLTYLLLNDNELSGLIPQTLGSLQHLTAVNLANNRLNSPFPDFLTSKPNYIEYISLSNNSWICPTPTWCSNSICSPCLPTIQEEQFLLDSILNLINNDIIHANASAVQLCTLDIGEQPNKMDTLLQHLGCQLANNIANGFTFFSNRTNLVLSLSWQVYDAILPGICAELSNVEDEISSFKNNIGNDEKLLAIANNALDQSTLQLRYWEVAINSTESLMTAEYDQIQYLASQIAIVYSRLEADYEAIEAELQSQMEDIERELQTIPVHIFFSSMFVIVDIVGGIGATLLGNPEAAVGMLPSLIGNIGSIIKSARSIPALEAQLDELESVYEDVLYLAQSTAAIDQLFTDINTTSTLPDLLPTITLIYVSESKLTNFIDALSSAMLKGNVESLEVDMNNMDSFSKAYIQLTINWYDLAMKLQTYQAQVNLLVQQNEFLSASINDLSFEVATLQAAGSMLYQLKVATQLRAIVYLLAEWEQINYYTLTKTPLSIPQNPTAAEISALQTGLHSSLILWKSTQTHGRSQMWLNYTLTATHDNTSFSSLYTTNSMSFSINLPEANKTSYYHLALLDVRAYLYPVQSSYPINVILEQQGLSRFYDQSFKNWNFSTPYSSYTFSYESGTLCPITTPFYPDSADYIAYSPYGDWQLTVPKHQITITDVQKISIYFLVTYYTSPSSTGSVVWGNYPFSNQRISKPPGSC